MTALNIWKAWQGARIEIEKRHKTAAERRVALVVWCQEDFIQPHRKEEVASLRIEMVPKMEALDMKVTDDRNDV